MAAVVSAERAAERVGARLRQDIFERSMELSLRWHDRMRSGELHLAAHHRRRPAARRAGRDLLDAAAGRDPAGRRRSSCSSSFNPALALVALAVVPLLLVFAVRQRRLVRSVQQDARAESGRFAGTATDLVRNVRAVQAFGRAPRSSAVFQRPQRSAARRQPAGRHHRGALGAGRRRRARHRLRTRAVVGGRQVLDGRLSTGDLLVVMTYLGALYSPVRGLSRLSGVLAKSTASAARVHEVLTAPSA